MRAVANAELEAAVPVIEEARCFLQELDAGAIAFTFQTFGEGNYSGDSLTRIIHGGFDDDCPNCLSSTGQARAFLSLSMKPTDLDERPKT